MNDSDTIGMLSRYSDERMQSCRRCYLQSFDVCNARFACDEFDGWLITSQTGVHDDVSRDVFQLRWNKYERMNATTRRIAIKCVSVGYSWLSGFELLIDDILFQSLWCDGNTKCWSKCVRRSSVFALLVESVVVDECGVGDCLLDKSASAFHSKQMKEKDTSNVLACACRSDSVVMACNVCVTWMGPEWQEQTTSSMKGSFSMSWTSLLSMEMAFVRVILRNDSSVAVACVLYFVISLLAHFCTYSHRSSPSQIWRSNRIQPSLERIHHHETWSPKLER